MQHKHIVKSQFFFAKLQKRAYTYKSQQFTAERTTRGRLSINKDLFLYGPRTILFYGLKHFYHSAWFVN